MLVLGVLPGLRAELRRCELMGEKALSALATSSSCVAFRISLI